MNSSSATGEVVANSYTVRRVSGQSPSSLCASLPCSIGLSKITFEFLVIRIKCVWSWAMIAEALLPSSSLTRISIYSFSLMFSFSFIEMRFSSMYCCPLFTAASLTSRSTSSPYSLLPIKAPRAMAIGSPTMPVPGMPTPMAFFRILALSKASIRAGRFPRVSVAFATHRDTAMGSVQPIAGTTSCLISLII